MNKHDAVSNHDNVINHTQKRPVFKAHLVDNEICLVAEDLSDWSKLNDFFNQNHPHNLNHPHQMPITKAFEAKARVIKSDQGPWDHELRISLE